MEWKANLRAMKTRLQLAAVLLLSSLNHPFLPAQAQGTLFTYQGRLNSGANAATGSYDLVFSLYDTNAGGTSLAGPVTNTAVPVTNGLFTVAIDFGAGVFTGGSNWLSIGVRAPGDGTFTILTPRQQLTPTPYALYAESANAVGLTGTIPLAQLPDAVVTNNATGVTLSGTFNGAFNGTAGASNAWQLTGNSGTTSGVNFLGTSDNEPLQLRANNTIGWQLQYASATIGSGFGASTMSGVNLIGGLGNTISNGVIGGTVAGGGYAWRNALTHQNYPNVVGGSWGAIGGGANNSAGNYGTVPGGFANVAGGLYSFAAGQEAQALNPGAFVWADSQGGVFNDNGTNSFNIRAQGGVFLDNSTPAINFGNTTRQMLNLFGTNYAIGIQNWTEYFRSSGGYAWYLNGAHNDNQNSPGAGGTTLMTLDSSGDLNIAGTLTLPSRVIVNAAGYNTFLYSDNDFNFFIGADAGNVTTGAQGGTSDLALGGAALSRNTSGYENIAIGLDAAQFNTTGNDNTAVGTSALMGDWDDSGNFVTGNNNVAVGAWALQSDESGSNNVANGAFALFRSTTGAWNIANGCLALFNNVSGNKNTANGYKALYNNTSGVDNTANGYATLSACVGDKQNVADGIAALENLNGGNQNTASGAYALQNLVGGSGNVALGYNAGNSLTAGSNNIYIGNAGQGSESGVIRIGTSGTQTQTYIAGTLYAPVLTITGGSDLAEPFAITTADQPVSAGAVVVIDEANPGRLKLTDQPYDTRVAGVVSGANGIHPGIQMHQEGLLDGGRNIALTGRVYVQADTSNGPIKPGDLLTTSGTPGHAMKVSDHTKAQGAILGKAMTALSDGQGMVLVLVTLQ